MLSAIWSTSSRVVFQWRSWGCNLQTKHENNENVATGRGDMGYDQLIMAQLWNIGLKGTLFSDKTIWQPRPRAKLVLPKMHAIIHVSFQHVTSLGIKSNMGSRKLAMLLRNGVMVTIQKLNTTPGVAWLGNGSTSTSMQGLI